MSFRCEFCDVPQPPRTKPASIITKVRKIFLKPTQTEKNGLVTVVSRETFEVVEEKKACPCCANIPTETAEIV